MRNSLDSLVTSRTRCLTISFDKCKGVNELLATDDDLWEAVLWVLTHTDSLACANIASMISICFWLASFIILGGDLYAVNDVFVSTACFDGWDVPVIAWWLVVVRNTTRTSFQILWFQSLYRVWLQPFIGFHLKGIFVVWKIPDGETTKCYDNGDWNKLERESPLWGI